MLHGEKFTYISVQFGKVYKKFVAIKENVHIYRSKKVLHYKCKQHSSIVYVKSAFNHILKI